MNDINKISSMELIARHVLNKDVKESTEIEVELSGRGYHLDSEGVWISWQYRVDKVVNVEYSSAFDDIYGEDEKSIIEEVSTIASGLTLENAKVLVAELSNNDTVEYRIVPLEIFSPGLEQA